MPILNEQDQLIAELEWLRKDTQVSLTTWAKKAGVHRTTLSHLFRGSRCVTWPMFLRLIRALDREVRIRVTERTPSAANAA